jgi:hypothetical protein
MDILTKIWQDWNVPIDILNLVKVYRSPYRCPLCQRNNFLASNERFCSICTTPIIKEYENGKALLDKFVEIYKNDGDRMFLIEEEFLKYKTNYPSESISLLKQYEESSQRMKELEKEHQATLNYFYSGCGSLADVNYAFYFSKINCVEYAKHNSICASVNAVSKEIKKARIIWEDIRSASTASMLDGFRRVYIHNYQNFKAAAFVH